SRLVSGSAASASLTVLTDKLSDRPGVFGPISANLSAANPTFTTKVNVQPGSPGQRTAPGRSIPQPAARQMQLSRSGPR
ncbi:MAG: hypothetical protein NZ561_02555, partial [Phycisphaerae bacterium]|nr:hypothetical protein [Phycisphaerae bacterium]MDW8263193.1 hypothetical protein [Phycisphaerales bacterium]